MATVVTLSQADLIHQVADYIWAEQQKNLTRGDDCDRFLADNLEAAEIAADNSQIKCALFHMEAAARQTFGLWSEDYVNMARLLGFEPLTEAKLLFGWL